MIGHIQKDRKYQKTLSEFILKVNFFVVSGMLDNFVNDIKQECNEEDHLEIENDLKQEDEGAQCSSLNQHVKIEDVQYNCQKKENFVDVSLSNSRCDTCMSRNVENSPYFQIIKVVFSLQKWVSMGDKIKILTIF